MKNIAAIERIKKALKKQNYICDDELAFSLFLSQNLEKPLLLEGEPGVGKTEVAKVIADVLGRKLIRPQVIETTVAGACYLAGLGVGLWQGTGEIRKIWQADRDFAVQMNSTARRKRMASWEKALERTLL